MPRISRNSIWQWPNILAIDAAAIAATWLWLFAIDFNVSLSPWPFLVLGLSVWLTYMADRLFDAARRPLEQLISVRHRFAKNFQQPLWCFWFLVLISNILIALVALTKDQFTYGVYLLVLCLLYTTLNQIVFVRQFPKEFFVAVIFSLGVFIFLIPKFTISAFGAFSMLCLLNCIIIGRKEINVDSALEIRSLASLSTIPLIILTAVASAIFALGSNNMTQIALLWSISLLLILSLMERHIFHEAYRCLADGILFTVPLAVLCTSS